MAFVTNIKAARPEGTIFDYKVMMQFYIRGRKWEDFV